MFFFHKEIKLLYLFIHSARIPIFNMRHAYEAENRLSFVQPTTGFYAHIGSARIQLRNVQFQICFQIQFTICT